MDAQIEKFFFGGERKVKLTFANQQYIFDKLIFYIVISILLISAVIILSINNMDKSQHLYLNCPAEVKYCFNPYYNNSQVCGQYISWDDYICKQEILLAPFEYGKPEPFYVKNFGSYAIILVIISLIINHLIYNRKFKFKELKEELNNVQNTTNNNENK